MVTNKEKSNLSSRVRAAWQDEENWHSRTMGKFAEYSLEQLHFVVKDATEAAVNAEKMGNDKKAGQYRDEVHYAYMELRKRNSASLIEARVKGNDEYEWMIFTGKVIEATNDKGRTLKLVKGDKYGARRSSSGGGKFIRLVTEKEGLTKVFTCDDVLAAYLGKNSKACATPK